MKTLNNEFITYEQALALKELGFDEPCMAWYNYNGEVLFKFKKPHTDDINLIKAPLKQQVFKWFREKHQLTSWVYNSDTNKFFYTILQNGRIVKAHEPFITYEEAEDACINKLIEIVKNATNK